MEAMENVMPFTAVIVKDLPMGVTVDGIKDLILT
jgi:hypothetical protein